MLCPYCGKDFSDQAPACPVCGQPNHVLANVGRSPKDKFAAILFCFALGVFGIHRFYVGKVGTGILQLLTLGGFGIWVLIDFILLVCGKFTDKQGRKLL